MQQILGERGKRNCKTESTLNDRPVCIEKGEEGAAASEGARGKGGCPAGVNEPNPVVLTDRD